MKLQFKKFDSLYHVLLNDNLVYIIEKFNYGLLYSNINYHFEIRNIQTDKIKKFTYLKDCKKFITNKILQGLKNDKCK